MFNCIRFDEKDGGSNREVMGKTKAKTFGQKPSRDYLCRPLKRPVRLRVRTPPFHGGDTSSNLVRATKKSRFEVKPARLFFAGFYFKASADIRIRYITEDL